MVDFGPLLGYNVYMIKNTSPSSSTPTLPKGCIYRVNGYLNHKVKYHIVNLRNELRASGFKTYDEAVAKAIEMDKSYKAAKKAFKYSCNQSV